MVARRVGCGPVPPTWKRDEQDAGDPKGQQVLMGLIFG